MSLTSNEKARLTLRLVAARYLGDNFVNSSTADAISDGREILRRLSKETERAEFVVEDVRAYLRAAIEEINSRNSSTLCKELTCASEELSRIANSVQEGNGDGEAVGAHINPSPCAAGLMPLYGKIEQHLRKIYGVLPSTKSGDRRIRYQTWLLDREVPRRQRPESGVGGTTISEKNERTVDMRLSDKSLSHKELCLIAYVVFHELICHAFQAWYSAGSVENAWAACHWSEGWMDSIAYDETIRWIDGLQRDVTCTLGCDRESAVDEIRHAHRRRYVDPEELGSTNIKLRTWARKSLHELKQALLEHGFVNTVDEALVLVSNFSFSVNAHEDATLDSLSVLCTKIGSILDARSVSAMEHMHELLKVCADFVGTKDHDLLLEKVEELATKVQLSKGDLTFGVVAP